MLERARDYRLVKNVWTWRDNRLPLALPRNATTTAAIGSGVTATNCELDEHGLMRRRIATINDLRTEESERKYDWPLGRRRDDHPALSDL